MNDLKERGGLELVQLNQYTPPETDLRLLYKTLLDWLPKVQDPLTLSTCLGRLLEPAARVLVKENRELLLSLARSWNEPTAESKSNVPKRRSNWLLNVLAQSAMKAVLKRDVPEVLSWAKNRSLPAAARASYVRGLQRFARTPGLARDALADLVNAEAAIGGAAVWALAGAMQAEALPILRELRQSSPNELVCSAATAAVKKIEARSIRVTLQNASPAQLPEHYTCTSIEFDTEKLPELLASLERQLTAHFRSQDHDQLALSANQLKRGQRRFYILPCSFSDESVSPMGFGLYAEDEDAIVVEIRFDKRLRVAVNAASDSFLNSK